MSIPPYKSPHKGNVLMIACIYKIRKQRAFYLKYRVPIGYRAITLYGNCCMYSHGILSSTLLLQSGVVVSLFNEVTSYNITFQSYWISLIIPWLGFAKRTSWLSFYFLIVNKVFKVSSSDKVLDVHLKQVAVFIAMSNVLLILINY